MDHEAGERWRGHFPRDHGDDGLTHAGLRQLVEHMVQQGPPGDRHQRFRHPVGDRAHANAKAGGEDHGFGGLDGHVQKVLKARRFQHWSRPILSR